MMLWRAVIAIGLSALSAHPLRAAEPISVVASFSILGDLVREVGGEQVAVTTLVGPNTDMHVFQPAPGDARRLLGAQLVVINGLGFEGWADRLVGASGYKGPVVTASRGVAPLQAEDDHDGGTPAQRAAGQSKPVRNDPHAWQDVTNVKTYVANIRDGLIRADGANRAHYETRASAYLQALDMLDGEIRAAYAAIPADSRRVITSHDAFGYYGRAYGVTFHAPQGISGDAETSAQAVAALIRQIRRERVQAIFVESISNPRVIERIAQETGARIGPPLYSDALSAPDGRAATYLAMMRHNTRLLSAAMTSVRK
jgi:zinc/manganese transport system substrate-binding protein